MRVKALQEIPSAKGTIPVGQMLEISPALLEKLGGKVEVVVDQPTAGDLPMPAVAKLPQVEIARTGRALCFACWSTDLWKSKHGVTACRVCHPPAPGAETI